MKPPEVILYKVDELAEHWKGKVSKDRIEDYLYSGKLRYTVRLSGNFDIFRILENGNKERIHSNRHRSKSIRDPRYDEFLIQNYYLVAPDCQNNFIDLGIAELLRLEDDGYWYEYNIIRDVPNIGKEDLFVSKEEVECFEREHFNKDESTPPRTGIRPTIEGREIIPVRKIPFICPTLMVVQYPSRLLSK